MKVKLKKFLGNACFFAVGLGIIVSLIQLMEWVDPWWSTGYNKSLIWDQIAALTFWAIITTFLSMPALVREGIFFRSDSSRGNMVDQIKRSLPTGRLWVGLPMGAMIGGLYMLLILIDSSAELAVGMAPVITILATGFVMTVEAFPSLISGFRRK